MLTPSDIHSSVFYLHCKKCVVANEHHGVQALVFDGDLMILCNNQDHGLLHLQPWGGPTPSCNCCGSANDKADYVKAHAILAILAEQIEHALIDLECVQKGQVFAWSEERVSHVILRLRDAQMRAEKEIRR